MKVFFSWSGTESREVAELLAAWLSSVLQNVDTYVSSQDIQKGERWASSISANLAEIDFGVVVLTKSNLYAPWVSFEAGALSKHVGFSRVVPILCDLSDSDLTKHPLSQFQYAKLEKNDLLELVRSVNRQTEKQLSDALVENTFSHWWEDLKKELSNIEFNKAPPDVAEKGHESPLAKRVEKMEDSIDEVLHILRRSLNASRPSREAWSNAAQERFRSKFAHAATEHENRPVDMDKLVQSLARLGQSMSEEQRREADIRFAEFMNSLNADKGDKE